MFSKKKVNWGDKHGLDAKLEAGLWGSDRRLLESLLESCGGEIAIEESKVRGGGKNLVGVLGNSSYLSSKKRNGISKQRDDEVCSSEVLC